jgi:hypothetical protein
MAITTIELKQNLAKYIALSATEQILIMDDEGFKVVAMLSNPNQDRIETAKSLFGILPADVNIEDSKAERLAQI